ncbi:uncharacterized protein LOC107359738 isoform X3 [Tetranychus urticae]|uniref:Uncharacterized protein n=1 Tax=Tetranychus urticae TaxID=32264 RepID=T1JT94_TETUR|nr:uncharacterized protein LOC107359738 isoform X3 [Tetranychus urticae]
MRFLVILSLALCIVFAYGASVDRSKRDIQEDMENIIAEIQKNGIGAIGGKITEFAHNFKDRITSWHCPDVFEILNAMNKDELGKVARLYFVSAVCGVLHLH